MWLVGDGPVCVRACARAAWEAVKLIPAGKAVKPDGVERAPMVQRAIFPRSSLPAYIEHSMKLVCVRALSPSLHPAQVLGLRAPGLPTPAGDSAGAAVLAAPPAPRRILPGARRGTECAWPPPAFCRGSGSCISRAGLGIRAFYFR